MQPLWDVSARQKGVDQVLFDALVAHGASEAKARAAKVPAFVMRDQLASVAAAKNTSLAGLSAEVAALTKDVEAVQREVDKTKADADKGDSKSDTEEHDVACVARAELLQFVELGSSVTGATPTWLCVPAAKAARAHGRVTLIMVTLSR